MKPVWAELLKRKRVKYKSTEVFFHGAIDPPRNWSARARAQHRRAQALRDVPNSFKKNEAKRLEIYEAMNQIADIHTWGRELPIQERALVAFFDQVFEFARSDSSPVPRGVAQERRDYYLRMAACLREDAEQHDPIQGMEVGIAGVGSVRARLPLIEAALVYEELADSAAPPPGHPLLVERTRRGDKRQIGFVIELVDATTAIFGKALCGIVAILANVAFDCKDWNAERVRKTTKSPTRNSAF
jgi:hypothetical protein